MDQVALVCLYLQPPVHTLRLCTKISEIFPIDFFSVPPPQVIRVSFVLSISPHPQGNPKQMNRGVEILVASDFDNCTIAPGPDDLE